MNQYAGNVIVRKLSFKSYPQRNFVHIAIVKAVEEHTVRPLLHGLPFLTANLK